MPRPLRIQDAGCLHHVISRGNDRQNLFNSQIDYQTYLELIQESQKLFPVKIYNYVLMSNHIHMLIEPLAEGSLSRFMEHLSKSYAKYFNKTNNRVGHVFQGRFKSFLVEGSHYFLHCSRYIDFNPVKCGGVASPSEYFWSGYNWLAFGKKNLIHLDVHPVYEELGKTPEERQIAYRAIVLNTPEPKNFDLLNRRVCVLKA